MARVVFYQHPLAENYSLKYSSERATEVSLRRNEYEGNTKLIGYPFDTPVFVLYEADANIDDASEVEFDRDWLSERIDGLPRHSQVVAFRLVELLESAVDVRAADEFRLYKAFEPQKVHQALDHVSWGTELPRVAGELMSNLVLRHALPNANHRTGIAMLQFCIESVAPEFEMPRTHIDDETWEDWVDPYIVDSKRLITVRRNNVRFRQLEDLGVDIIERKDGIQLRLADYELDMRWHEALTTYASLHESHCRAFAEALLERAEREDLHTHTGPSREAFIEYLESGLVERDLRELF